MLKTVDALTPPPGSPARAQQREVQGVLLRAFGPPPRSGTAGASGTFAKDRSLFFGKRGPIRHAYGLTLRRLLRLDSSRRLQSFKRNLKAKAAKATVQPAQPLPKASVCGLGHPDGGSPGGAELQRLRRSGALLLCCRVALCRFALQELRRSQDRLRKEARRAQRPSAKPLFQSATCRGHSRVAGAGWPGSDPLRASASRQSSQQPRMSRIGQPSFASFRSLHQYWKQQLGPGAAQGSEPKTAPSCRCCRCRRFRCRALQVWGRIPRSRRSRSSRSRKSPGRKRSNEDSPRASRTSPTPSCGPHCFRLRGSAVATVPWC